MPRRQTIAHRHLDRLAVLQWLTVLVPAVCAGLYETVRHTLLASELPNLLGTLVAVLGFVVTGKVLSPQYLLWLLPLTAAGLVVADSTALRQWTGGLVGATVLTQVVFPFAYGAITTGVGPPVALPVLALAVRNLLLIIDFDPPGGHSALITMTSSEPPGRAP